MKIKGIKGKTRGKHFKAKNIDENNVTSDVDEV